MGLYKRLAWGMGSIVLVALLGGQALDPVLQADANNEAIAAAASGAISIHCTAPESTAFIPTLSYTVLPALPASLNAGCEAHVTIRGAVNGDALARVACRHKAQTIVLRHTTPTMKLAGLQCKEVTSSELAFIPPVDVASPTIDVAAPGHALPLLPSKPASKVLFGNGGTIGLHPLRDGQDWDHDANGEIAFGGNSRATGGSHTVMVVESRTATQLTPNVYFVFTAR